MTQKITIDEFTPKRYMTPEGLFYLFTYEELSPLIEWLARGPTPEEKHRPGITLILKRLDRIKEENRK